VPDPDTVTRWRRRLRQGPLDEADGLALLADFGVPVVAHAVVGDVEAAVAAAERIGFPVVLKTATPGILHKSDVGGVRLNLRDRSAVTTAYADLSARLGPRALVAGMVTAPSVEMILGIVRDPDFGPTVLVGTGGIHAEILKDAVTARPPFDAAEARRLVDRLRLRRLLDGVRGAPAADIETLAETIARFSALAAALGDLVASMDVNPLLAGAGGALAVDALVVPVPSGPLDNGPAPADNGA
jgi:succinyl-CoA synthetase beta subunit